MANITKRSNKDGTTTYKVLVRLKGHPAQTASFQRLTDAKKWASATETAIRENRHFQSREAKKRTLRELITKYKQSASAKTLSDRKHIFLYWSDALGAYLLQDITPARIADKRDELTLTGKAPATVQKYLATLSHVFSMAVKEYGWLDSNPITKVTKPSLPNGRVRFLSDDERDALIKAASPDDANKMHPALLPVITLALSTGMRQAEIMYLFWREPKSPPADTAWGVVHIDTAKIVLHATKNGSKRVLPLVGPAMDMLKEMKQIRRLDTDLVFPAKRPPKKRDEAGNPLPIEPIDLRKPWENALKKAGIENFKFHDLRHSCASYLAMGGASLSEIAEVLGHKSLSMVARYSHLSEAHTAGVVERMNSRIFGGAA